MGHAVCIGGCLLGFAIHQFVLKLEPLDAEPTYEDSMTGEDIPRPGYEAVAKKAGVAEVNVQVS